MNNYEAALLGGAASKITTIRLYQERIALYSKEPKLCKFCGKPLSYEKRRNIFCNRSCSQSFNNKGIRRHGSIHYCLNCSKKVKDASRKYCSVICHSKHEWKKWSDRVELLGYFEGYDASKSGGTVSRPKRYLLIKQNGKCAICGRKTWCGKPIPFVLDHINGDSGNWKVKNLRVICRNCDGQLDTYCGKNKGLGTRPFINSRDKDGKYIKTYKIKKESK